MFSLIISIIAIALVAALAGASVYYGGSAFNKGSADAEAAAFKNEGSQIAGSMSLATADGHTVSALVNLSDGSLGESTSGALNGDVYLTQIPADLTLASNYVTRTVSAGVCASLGLRNNDGTTATTTSAAVFNAATQVGLFGCNNNGGTTAYYKVQ